MGGFVADYLYRRTEILCTVGHNGREYCKRLSNVKSKYLLLFQGSAVKDLFFVLSLSYKFHIVPLYQYFGRKGSRVPV